jgi:hypothetical protein
VNPRAVLDIDRQRRWLVKFAAGQQPFEAITRLVEAGWRTRSAVGRIGRRANPPPQLGQTPRSRMSAQARQNVHSNEQILAWVDSGGRSTPQHSQLGRSSSIFFSSP